MRDVGFPTVVMMRLSQASLAGIEAWVELGKKNYQTKMQYFQKYSGPVCPNSLGKVIQIKLNQTPDQVDQLLLLLTTVTLSALSI